MRLALGHDDRLVAHEPLHRVERHARLNQPRGKGMPQRMEHKHVAGVSYAFIELGVVANHAEAGAYLVMWRIPRSGCTSAPLLRENWRGKIVPCGVLKPPPLASFRAFAF